MMILAMLLGLLIVGLLISACASWISARIVRAGHPSFKRALSCGLAIMALGVLLNVAGMFIPSSPVAMLVAVGVQILIGLLLIWFVISRVLGTTFLRAMLLSVPYFLFSGLLAVAASFFIIKPYCLEAFVISSNNMAPTLIGWHHETTCPHCQGKAIVGATPPEDLDRGRPPGPKTGICTQCRKISEFDKWSPETAAPMRMICNKLMQPERDDAVVFIHPRRFVDEGKRIYVMRLIGLPGEKVEIKDEAVWINGQKWTPPPELSGLIYTSLAGGTLPDERDREPRSWDLGPDDFFVLGDFTTNSSDSRDWGPVPRANLVGVGTLIYWPPTAWRILR